MAKVYRPDGEFTAGGLSRALLLGCAAGIAAGYALGLIGAKLFSLVLLWPALMGGAAGGVVMLAVKKTAIRNAAAAFAVGAVCGSLAYVASHHAHYLLTKGEIEGALAKRTLDEGPAAGSFDDVLEAQTGSRGFVGFVRYKAKLGESISRHGRGGVELGETGTWILYALEWLAAALIGGSLPFGRAREPFCSGCGLWYRPARRIWLSEGTPVNRVRELLQGDRFSVLGELAASGTSASQVCLQVHTCPQCDVADTVFEIRRIQPVKKDQARESSHGRFQVSAGDARSFLGRLDSRAQEPRA